MDCGPIRAQIAANRLQQQWGTDADAEAAVLFSEVPHQYVAPDLLVEFLLPAAGHGRATGAGELNEQKQLVRMSLCDKLYREIVTRQFVAANPSYR